MIKTDGISRTSPEKKKEILGELDNLESEIGLMDEATGNIGGRIRFVQREVVCAPDEIEKEPESSCEMAATLNRLTRRIRHIREALQREIDILEI